MIREKNNNRNNIPRLFTHSNKNTKLGLISGARYKKKKNTFRNCGQMVTRLDGNCTLPSRLSTAGTEDYTSLH